MRPTFKPGTRRNQQISDTYVEVFRCTDEVADEVFEKFNRYAHGQKLEMQTREPDVEFVPRVSTFANDLIRRLAMTAEKLREIQEIILDAGVDSVVGVVLGGEVTLEWIKSAKPEPPPRPREPVAAPPPAV